MQNYMEGSLKSGNRVNSDLGEEGSLGAHRRERKHKMGPERKKMLGHNVWSTMDTHIYAKY